MFYQQEIPGSESGEKLSAYSGPGAKLTIGGAGAGMMGAGVGTAPVRVDIADNHSSDRTISEFDSR